MVVALRILVGVICIRQPGPSSERTRKALRQLIPLLEAATIAYELAIGSDDTERLDLGAYLRSLISSRLVGDYGDIEARTRTPPCAIELRLAELISVGALTIGLVDLELQDIAAVGGGAPKLLSVEVSREGGRGVVITFSHELRRMERGHPGWEEWRERLHRGLLFARLLDASLEVRISQGYAAELHLHEVVVG